VEGLHRGVVVEEEVALHCLVVAVEVEGVQVEGLPPLPLLRIAAWKRVRHLPPPGVGEEVKGWGYG